MAGKYLSYAEYKDSGVEWLGEVPSHWSAVPLKFKCTYNDEVLPETLDHEAQIEYVDIGSVSASDGITKIEQMSFSKAPSRARRVVRDGDVIISTVRTYLEAITPIVCPQRNLVVSTGFAVIRPKRNLHKRYAAYALRAKGFIEEVVARSVGISYPAINASDLVAIYSPVPSFEEQTQIANFLDHETAKIDTLIAKQQQLIKLLKEKRQAVISHAVTKGLNPDVPMKDSGVEWLGEVPEHWDVRRIGTLFSESSARAESKVELEYPILRVSIHYGISDKELDEEEMDRKVSRSEDRSLYKVVEANDLAYNMMRAWQGGFGAAKVNGLISPAYVVCKPKTELNSSYFELVLRSPNAVTELKRFSRGITDFRLRLYWDEFKTIQVPIPPVEELVEILEHISKINSKYDQIAESAQDQIDLLQERRTALISAAVTGKIDVRDWKPEQSETRMETTA